jgi:(E)-4-hydroxy-3-methylbut-2-enyl-diphosphate synthase
LEENILLFKKTRSFNIGKIGIGGDHPITIQSMTNTKTSDIEGTVKQIISLKDAGCQLVRLAINNLEEAKAIKTIKSFIDIPIIADIQFDYRLALLSIENGADKIRINPGNIGDEWKLKEIATALLEKDIPVRVGSNSGSLSEDLLQRYGVSAQALVESALAQSRLLEKYGVKNIVLSMKSSDVLMTIEAYKLASQLSDLPLHIGLTEAGTPGTGTIRSSVALGVLLYNNIGNTIRVSLTGDPIDEIWAAKDILSSLKLISNTPTLISCPTCGRTNIDLVKITKELEKRLRKLNKPLKVAVMGCAVNGPGEAKEADIGVAGGKGEGIIFKNGKIIKKVPEERMLEELWTEIQRMVEN